MNDLKQDDTFRVVVAGGGAAGFFAAITCAESLPDSRVDLYESGETLLENVLASGRGRGNISHDGFDPEKAFLFYPRGGDSLAPSFRRWRTVDTIDWFESRGVRLIRDPDGRIFPRSGDAVTVRDCLLDEARRAGIRIHTSCGLSAVHALSRGFAVTFSDGSRTLCDRLLLATGYSRSLDGILRTFGHTVVPRYSTLFALHTSDPRAGHLEGVNVDPVSVRVDGQALAAQEGPVMVADGCFTGPAILKLSSWGSSLFQALKYQCRLSISWLPDRKLGQLVSELEQQPASVLNRLPAGVVMSVLAGCGLSEDAADLTETVRRHAASVAAGLLDDPYVIDGMVPDSEAVPSGGVRLDEVDPSTMASLKCPGLFFAGGILDLYGLSGGFNLQSAWTTGWVAGKSMGQDILTV